MSDVNPLHRHACECDECQRERKRLALVHAVTAAAMQYTGPPPHKSDEHHKLCAACDALRELTNKEERKR